MEILVISPKLFGEMFGAEINRNFIQIQIHPNRITFYSFPSKVLKLLMIYKHRQSMAHRAEVRRSLN